MLVIAHRGASSEAPENSMEAFEKAIALGADGIELDVRSTADGVPIVMHDHSLKRTTGLKLLVSKATAAQVGKARLSNGEGIPTIENILDEFATRTAIYLELKDRKSGPEVNRIVGEHPGAKVTVSSFDPFALDGVGQIPKALLWDKRGSPMGAAMRHGCAAIHPRLRRATARMVCDAHEWEMDVIVWDVRNPREVARAAKIGADGLIADDILMAQRVAPD